MGVLVQPDGLEIPTGYDAGEISDGWHTFDELYHYRMLYNAGLFNEFAKHDAFWEDESTAAGQAQPYFDVHKSWRHSDGELCFGKDNYFIVCAKLPGGWISNHYHGDHWDLFKIPERERAVEYDGHTPQDVVDRLEDWLKSE